MGQTYDGIDQRLQRFIENQPVFFLASLPRADGGHANLSPKGRRGTLRVRPSQIRASLDFGGSHAESLANLRKNGRITLMWCPFEGRPKAVRVHGAGEVVFRDDPGFENLAADFAEADGSGVRAVVAVSAKLVSDTCGYSVPFMEYVSDRDLNAQFFDLFSDAEFGSYFEAKEHNRTSIDGLSALPLPLPHRARARNGSQAQAPA